MKRSAMEKCEQETVIVIDHEGNVSAWTSSLPMYNKLTKLGWEITVDSERYAWLDGKPKCVRFKKIGASTRKLKQANPEALKAMRAARKK